MLCSVVKHLEAVEHSRSGKKHSTASRVFPYTSFVLYRFLRALQQNTAQSRLLYLLNTNSKTCSNTLNFGCKMLITLQNSTTTAIYFYRIVKGMIVKCKRTSVWGFRASLNFRNSHFQSNFFSFALQYNFGLFVAFHPKLPRSRQKGLFKVTNIDRSINQCKRLTYDVYFYCKTSISQGVLCGARVVTIVHFAGILPYVHWIHICSLQDDVLIMTQSHQRIRIPMNLQFQHQRHSFDDYILTWVPGFDFWFFC